MMIHRIKTDKTNNDKIFHRQDLIEEMTETLEIMKVLYESNFLSMYYELLSKQLIVNRNNKKYLYDDDFVEKYADKNTEIGKRSLFLKEVSDCLKDRTNGYARFVEQYQDKMVNVYHVESVSEAEASLYVFQAFQYSVNELGSMAKKSANPPLTMAEMFMFDEFMRHITSPMRNLKIQIPEGETKCWYDRYPHNDYRSDLDQSITWVKQHANDLMGMFNIPDKEAENEKEEYDEAELE